MCVCVCDSVLLVFLKRNVGLVILIENNVASDCDELQSV